MPLINAKIVEVFDYKGETLHLRHQTEIKALLAPFFVGIERNFYELFGTNKIDENIIKSVKIVLDICRTIIQQMRFHHF